MYISLRKIPNPGIKNQYTLGPFYLRWAVAAGTFVAILLVLPAAMNRALWLAFSGSCTMAGLAHLTEKKRFRWYITPPKKVSILLAVIAVIGTVAGATGLFI